MDLLTRAGSLSTLRDTNQSVHQFISSSVQHRAAGRRRGDDIIYSKNTCQWFQNEAVIFITKIICRLIVSSLVKTRRAFSSWYPTKESWCQSLRQTACCQAPRLQPVLTYIRLIKNETSDILDREAVRLVDNTPPDNNKLTNDKRRRTQFNVRRPGRHADCVSVNRPQPFRCL